MNRYPTWKYALIAFAILLAALYTLPNFFGESPAVQVSSGKTTVKVDEALLGRVEGALKAGSVPTTGVLLDANGLRVRFPDTDAQLKGRDLIEKTLNPDHDNPSYVVALNLLSSSPGWLTAVRALPMYLGLDLRGGVHFLLQVDMQAALVKRLEAYAGDLRTLLRDKELRHAGIAREGSTLRIRFRDAATRDKAEVAIAAQLQVLDLARRDDGQDQLLVATLKPAALKAEQELAIKQNITTLNRRVNQLGVAEPLIQQQGADRIVVQLPGVQDTAKAKDILGRTATLEVRLVDEDAYRSGSTFNVDVFPERKRDGSVSPVPVKKQVLVTGDQFVGAQGTLRRFRVRCARRDERARLSTRVFPSRFFA